MLRCGSLSEPNLPKLLLPRSVRPQIAAFSSGVLGLVPSSPFSSPLAFEEEEEEERRRRDGEGGGGLCRKRRKGDEEEEEGGLRVVGRRGALCGRRKEAEGDVGRERNAYGHDARRRTRKRGRACFIRGW